MEQKPYHYDGSIQISYDTNDETQMNIPFEITDEMRKNIGGNPFSMIENE
ncbi:hypothetical protein [Cytobacillus depressus]|nr:hypothetical protein [Cytobacillus depressus]